MSLYALAALPPAQRAAAEAHLATCVNCQQELHALQPVIDSFVIWPTDVLRPTQPLWGRLAHRIAQETGGDPVFPPESAWSDPEWEHPAPGITVKLLAADRAGGRVTMLVRLEPGGEYPPHTHAGVEELHLLEGELWINERKLYPGDYNRAEPGTADERVWSETGCTCVLITSPSDVLA